MTTPLVSSPARLGDVLDGGWGAALAIAATVTTVAGWLPEPAHTS